MQIEITERGFDTPVVSIGNTGIEMLTHYGAGSFSCYQGKGFSFWNNSYQFSSDTLLHARADMPVLELHITRSGIWKGEWDGVEELDLHPAAFNLTYTPYVMTTAYFKKKVAYRSCDIHFDLSYLQSLSADFPALDKFLLSVTKKRAVSLSKRNHHCTREMIAATEAILNNPFGPKVQPYILETKVKLILIEALEKIAADTGKVLHALRRTEKDALQYARQLIDAAPDTPLTHSELAKLSGLNECTLKRGFRLLFGVSPYQYHVQLKMDRAKEMLLSTREPLEYIAYVVGYSQSSSFGHEFKKMMGMTPGEFRKINHR
jgi:AraC-like DNA-binding protein